MRVLHLIPSYLPGTGSAGPISATHALNKALVKLGVEVTVCTTNLDGEKRLSVPIGVPVMIDGVRVYYFPVSFRPWCYSRALHRFLHQHVQDYDLMHGTSVFTAFSWLAARVAKTHRKPLVLSPLGSLMHAPLAHRAWKKRLYLALIERRNLAAASAVHFTTERERAEYAALGLPLKQALVIPHGYDLQGEPARMETDKKTVLFLGRITWIKGLDQLIPAFAEVVKQVPEARLVIAGPDDHGYQAEVEALVSSLHLDDHVQFTGGLGEEEKQAAFAEATLFVLPSYSENFGMAVVEAMAAGLPVIVTKEVGLADVIEASQAGIVLAHHGDLSSAMVQLLCDPARARAMGERGRALVLERFSPARIAERMRDAYATWIYGR